MIISLVLAACIAGAAAAQRRANGPRQRPLAEFSCDPNQLTSYTGVVVRYTRETGRTRLTIKTDWDTTESVTLTHPGSNDPSALFKYEGQPFTAADWPRIERTTGVLIPGTRATAWVCSDGRTMVDWATRRE
jgi:hypothetical protein